MKGDQESYQHLLKILMSDLLFYETELKDFILCGIFRSSVTYDKKLMILEKMKFCRYECVVLVLTDPLDTHRNNNCFNLTSFTRKLLTGSRTYPKGFRSRIFLH